MVRTIPALLVTVLLLLSGCTNSPLVQVCDPCGCKCVAAPLLTACGPIPRGDDEPAAVEVPATKLKKYEPSPNEMSAAVLVKKKIRGLQWEETNLDQAVMYLRTITGLNYYVTPKVREEKFEDIVYQANLDDVSIKTVLDLMTHAFGLRWELRDGVVWILTTEEIDGPIGIRYFDLKGLVPEPKKPAATPGMPQRAPLSDSKELAEATKKLIEQIHSEVHPSYWDAEDATIEGRSGILIVRASHAVADEIGRFLERERREHAPKGIPVNLQKKLDETRVNLSIKNSTIAEVVKILQIQTGLNLMIDPRIVSDVAQNYVVGMHLTDAPLSTALNMLAAAAGEHGTWMAKGNVFVLTWKEFAEEE